MILAVDVDYKADNTAIIAGVLFNSWEDNEASKVVKKDITQVLPYESGAFYKRELPCILALLNDIDEHLECIVVDGYVCLGKEHKGLGAYLYDALKHKTPIVGVAKNAFRDISESTYIYRGESKKPLYVTSIGMEQEKAKELILRMHGRFRLPTLLKDVDTYCRNSEL